MDGKAVLALVVIAAVVALVVVTSVRRNNRRASPPAPGQPVPVASAIVTPGSVAAERTNTLAILALVFGLFGGLLAIVFGHLALSQIKRTGELGRGLAITGLILGYLWLALAVVFVVFLVVGAMTGGYK